MKTKIEFINNKPYISLDNKTIVPMAYTTYFEECGEFGDFIKCGHKIFFINISFTDLPINNMTGFGPFRTGVFEDKTPDYSEFEDIVSDILKQCPDAVIFPRIHIAMPRSWNAANTAETVPTLKSGNRESLFSDIYRRDAAVLLTEMISHFNKSFYKDNIGGYHICGGTTQEWMHHDMFGSFCDSSQEKFRQWMLEEYNADNVPILKKEDFSDENMSYYTSRYGEFSCIKTAETIEFFAKTIKQLTNNELIVGTFYGYNAFVNDYMLGLHGLRKIISSPHIDFFSSPCCYDNNRYLGVDWGDMFPVDSVKLHNKLAFIECDIRTHNTKRMQASRPGRYPEGIYTTTDNNGNKTVWSGPENIKGSVSAIRKAFAHQLTKASGVWWFDMWGGWYHNDVLMDEIGLMLKVYKSSVSKDMADLPSAEVVLFIDEKAYINLKRGCNLNDTVNQLRVAMGNSGIPFDMCMVEDADKLTEKYKAAIFTAPVPSESGINAIKLFRDKKIPCIVSETDRPFYSTEELRNILVSFGVHCFNDGNNVIYSGGGYVGVHTVNDGKLIITLPAEYRILPLFPGSDKEFTDNKIIVEAEKHETYIFELFAAK